MFHFTEVFVLHTHLGIKKKKIHLLFFSLNEVKSGFSLIIFSLQDEHFLLEAHCHFVNTWIFSL